MRATILGSTVAIAALAIACDYPRTEPLGGDIDASGNGGIDANGGVGAVQADRAMVPFGQIDLAMRREEDVTFRNTGSAAVTFNGATIPGGGPFTVARSTCLGPIGAGELCTVTIAASPTVVGEATNQLAVETSVGTATIDLSVTGAAQVTVNVTGPGRVTSTPAGIDCGGGGATCMARFTATPVALAADNATTVRWTSGCTGNGTCSVTLDQARTVAGTTYAPLRRTYNDDDNGRDSCHAITAGPSNTMVISGEIRNIAVGYTAWARAYNASGDVLWSHTDIRSGSQCIGHDVVANADGTVVMAGRWYSASNTRQNHFLTKISASGSRVWYRESEIVNDDMYFGVAANAGGELIVTGFEPDSGGTREAWIRKLTSLGQDQSWTIARNGNADGDDVANKVAVDSAGNLLVAGYEANVSTGRDAWIAKYAPNRSLVWSYRVAGTGTASDEATDVAVNTADDTIVAVGTSDSDSWIRALTAASGDRWGHVLTGITLRAVALDAAGNALVTGTRGTELVARKYGPSGALIWERTVAMANGRGIAADAAGNVLVCGEEAVAGNQTNVLVLKYYQ